MDSGDTAEASSSSSLASSFRTSSCDLLSHTLTLGPHLHDQRGRLNLSDRKLSLQERSQTAASPCDSPAVSGRYIYPSLPYSPITSPHTSPRLPRRPTVESHSVSITDLQVESRRSPQPLWVLSPLSSSVSEHHCLSFSSTNVEAD